MKRTKDILKNTFTVGAFTALSRVLGLVREMFQSRLIGAGMEQSAFTLAFAIPNMARKLFGEGALTAAFVPVFKGEAECESLEKAAKLARAVMTMVLLMLGSLVLVSMGVLETIVKFRAELGLNDMVRLKLTIRLVKTLLPYMIFICGAAFGMGVLNSLGRFKAASFMPCLLNFCWIGILLWISFFPEMRLDQRIHRVSMAILAAGALQMAFLFWRMHVAGVSPIPTFKGWKDPKTLLVWKNLGVAALGGGAVQINYMLDQILAQKASPWAAGVIGYAERLMDLPLGIIGVAFGTVLLPTFAGLFAKGEVDDARSALCSSVKSMMLIMIPAALGMFALSGLITEVIYQGGSFDSTATLRVSRALAVYVLGLGFYGFQKSMVPWFQAQNDMKTPLKVSMVTVGVNATLNILAVFLLPEEWRHVGLAASTVVCALVGAVLLVWKARRRNGRTGLRHIVVPLAKMTAAALAMALCLKALEPHLMGCAAPIRLGLLISMGGAVYFGIMFLTMRQELKLIRRNKRKAE